MHSNILYFLQSSTRDHIKTASRTTKLLKERKQEFNTNIYYNHTKHKDYWNKGSHTTKPPTQCYITTIHWSVIEVTATLFPPNTHYILHNYQYLPLKSQHTWRLTKCNIAFLKFLFNFLLNPLLISAMAHNLVCHFRFWLHISTGSPSQQFGSSCCSFSVNNRLSKMLMLLSVS